MKCLVDQDVYRSTVVFLNRLGHDVATVASKGLSQADDSNLLRVAHQEERILVTRDRDFGGLVFVQGSGAGVIYLRISPSIQNAVHAELDRVLNLYPEQRLLGSFVVVEAGRHRIRRLGPGSGP